MFQPILHSGPTNDQLSPWACAPIHHTDLNLLYVASFRFVCQALRRSSQSHFIQPQGSNSDHAPAEPPRPEPRVVLPPQASLRAAIAWDEPCGAVRPMHVATVVPPPTREVADASPSPPVVTSVQPPTPCASSRVESQSELDKVIALATAAAVDTKKDTRREVSRKG